MRIMHRRPLTTYSCSVSPLCSPGGNTVPGMQRFVLSRRWSASDVRVLQFVHASRCEDRTPVTARQWRRLCGRRRWDGRTFPAPRLRSD